MVLMKDKKKGMTVERVTIKTTNSVEVTLYEKKQE